MCERSVFWSLFDVSRDEQHQSKQEQFPSSTSKAGCSTLSRFSGEYRQCLASVKYHWRWALTRKHRSEIERLSVFQAIDFTVHDQFVRKKWLAMSAMSLVEQFPREQSSLNSNVKAKQFDSILWRVSMSGVAIYAHLFHPNDTERRILIAMCRILEDSFLISSTRLHSSTSLRWIALDDHPDPQVPSICPIPTIISTLNLTIVFLFIRRLSTILINLKILNISLERDNETPSCNANGGKLHRFSELRSKNTSIATILHQWKSSVERLEEYSFYLRDSSSQSDRSLWECLHRGWFGKNCEYQLPRGETFEETLQWQRVMRNAYRQKVDIYGDVICYETLLSAWDEENCHLLEVKQSVSRRNSLSIASIGQMKCNTRRIGSLSSECDDHLCPLNGGSCRDGECIQDRQMFQWYKDYSSCRSGRDHYFLCQTHSNTRQWTMANGRCVDVYFNDGSDEESSRVTNRSRDEECSYLIRCPLVMGGKKDSPCGRNVNCVDRIREVCSSSSSLIRYPRGAMMGPFVFSLDDVARDWRTRSADFVLINGSVRCRDSLIVMNETIIPVNGNFILGDLINDQLCRRSTMDSSADRDQCYRGNESMLRCLRWDPCLSSTRIKDGFRDCVNGFRRRSELFTGDENGYFSLQLWQSLRSAMVWRRPKSLNELSSDKKRRMFFSSSVHRALVINIDQQDRHQF